jgi:hypothetical protein
MAVMMGKLYTALIAADVAEDKAIAAAEEAASFQNDLAKVKADLLVVKWMCGVIIVMVLSLVTNTFLHAG